MNETQITLIGVIIILIAIAVLYSKMIQIYLDVEKKKAERIKKEFKAVQELLAKHGLRANTFKEAKEQLNKIKYLNLN